MPPHLPRLFRVVLILALSMTGWGQGLAAQHDRIDSIEVVPGVHAPICHDGPAAAPARTEGGTRGAHDCCDACALAAPVVLPGSPDLTVPATVAYFAAHARGMPWSPRSVRVRGPRQAQGPPAA